jgi:hypothetical protein
MAIESDEIFLDDQPRQFGIEFQRFQDLSVVTLIIWLLSTSFPDDGDKEGLRNFRLLFRTDSDSHPGRFDYF